MFILENTESYKESQKQNPENITLNFIVFFP